MRKYLTYFRLSVLYELEHRVEFVTRILSNLIPPIGIYFVWKSLYQAGVSFGQYDLKHLATYFLVAAVIDQLTPTFMTIDSLGQEIQSGLLSANIIKPVRYQLFKLAHTLGERSTRLAIVAVIVATTVLLFKSQFYSPQTVIEWLLFIISSLLAIILAYWTFFSLSVCSFWLTRVLGFAFAISIVSSFLGGAVVPLDLLPNWLQLITNVLPFKYFIYFPIQVFTSQVSPVQASFGIITQLVWIAITYLISGPIWKIGLNRHEAVGS